MSLYTPLRNYCERTSEGLSGEPLNAISNVAFFIAAWALYQLYRRHASKDMPTQILILLIAVVGVGSTLFHIFANTLTMIFDVVPIASFTFYYLWVALRRLIGCSRLQSLMALIGFIAVASQMHNVPEGYRCNGSVDYFPCLAALCLIGITLRAKHHAAAKWVLRATGCFAVSLTLRSIDFWVCPVLPIGTHFLWHSLNGLMLYLLVCALLDHSLKKS